MKLSRPPSLRIPGLVGWSYPTCILLAGETCPLFGQRKYGRPTDAETYNICKMKVYAGKQLDGSIKVDHSSFVIVSL